MPSVLFLILLLQTESSAWPPHLDLLLQSTLAVHLPPSPLDDRPQPCADILLPWFSHPDPCAVAVDGRTALMLACAHDRVEVITSCMWQCICCDGQHLAAAGSEVLWQAQQHVYFLHTLFSNLSAGCALPLGPRRKHKGHWQVWACFGGISCGRFVLCYMFLQA